MSEWDRYSCCGGFIDDGHAPGCHREEAYAYSQLSRHNAHATYMPSKPCQEPERYKYNGRVYEVVVRSHSHYGPVTLETVDSPKETIDTYNNRLGRHPFERV